MKSSLNKIEALLESDDELPLDYYEVPATPAYLVDSRFTSIQFNWINNNQHVRASDKMYTAPNDSKLCDSPGESHFGSRPIIEKGVLLGHDLFCLKSVEGVTSDSTLIWLLNFFLYKDLQSRYEFLKGCLVVTVKPGQLDLKDLLNKTSNTHKTVIKI